MQDNTSYYKYIKYKQKYLQYKNKILINIDGGSKLTNDMFKFTFTVGDRTPKQELYYHYILMKFLKFFSFYSYYMIYLLIHFYYLL